MLTDQATLIYCVPSIERPKRRTLFFQWFGDMLLCLLIAIPFSLPAAITLTEGAPYPVSWMFWASMLAAYCGVCATAFFRLNRIRRTGAPVIGFSGKLTSGSWKWLLLTCAAVLLLSVMQSALLRILNIGPGSADPITVALSQTSGWALAPAVAALVLMGPVSEELLFRGLLMGRFGAHGYLISGTILSAVMFMLFYDDPRDYFGLFGTGVLLAWLYHRTNSLWPPIAVHALNNALHMIERIVPTTS